MDQCCATCVFWGCVHTLSVGNKLRGCGNKDADTFSDLMRDHDGEKCEHNERKES